MKQILLSSLKEDGFHFWILVTVAILVGISLNQFRDVPLSLSYQTKQQRLEKSVSHLTEAAANKEVKSKSGKSFHAFPENLSLGEFEELVNQKSALILDARPEIFHRLGHVPGSLALPRDEFENYYRKLQEKLEKDKDQPLAIYCSSSTCEDSVLVAETLKKLGYTQVAVFHGGWDEWTQAGFPQEK